MSDNAASSMLGWSIAIGMALVFGALWLGWFILKISLKAVYTISKYGWRKLQEHHVTSVSTCR